MTAEVHDLVGIGLGPFNLALAALAAPHAELYCLFLDENPEFSWHPGMMVAGARIQVPFLADLVSLVDPTSPFGYLAWLRDQGRLFGFYFAEAWHVPRAEYEAYCRDVAARLPSCRFGCRVTAVRQASLADGRDGFAVCFETLDGPRTVFAANVVLGIGTEPIVPAALRGLCEQAGALVTHSSNYLNRCDWIHAADDVTVLGSGQSGAEIVLDLLRGWHLPGRRLRWLTRSTAFEPMEYSKIGLEHFTPDYTDYFHALPETARDQLLAGQDRLYKAVSDATLAEIRAELDRRAFPRGPGSTGVTLLPGVEAVGGRTVEEGEALELEFAHARTGTGCTVRTERLVLATGYAPRPLTLLEPIDALVCRDTRGRPVIDHDHRVALEGTSAGLYVQNAELHTHGVGTPDLGLGAYRAATVLNAVAGRELYQLPERTAHTSFSPAAAARTDVGLTVAPPLPEAPARARHAQRAASRLGSGAAARSAPPPMPQATSQPMREKTPQSMSESRQIPSQPEDRSERRSSTAPAPSRDVGGTVPGLDLGFGSGAGFDRGAEFGGGAGTDRGAGFDAGVGLDAGFEFGDGAVFADGIAVGAGQIHAPGDAPADGPASDFGAASDRAGSDLRAVADIEPRPAAGPRHGPVVRTGFGPRAGLGPRGRRAAGVRDDTGLSGNLPDPGAAAPADGPCSASDSAIPGYPDSASPGYPGAAPGVDGAAGPTAEH